MAYPTRTHKQIQILFTGLFLISLMIFITVSLVFGQPPGDQPSKLPAESVRIIEIISLLTSVISLVALISATVIGWTREKREVQMTIVNHRLQEIRIKREEIALEREKAEFDKIRAQTRAE